MAKRQYECEKITVLNECRAHPPFNVLTYSRDKSQFDFHADGSVTIIQGAKYCRFGNGQWMGFGSVKEG